MVHLVAYWQIGNREECNAMSLLTPAQAADLLQVSMNTLAKWRMDGTGPAYSRVGGKVVRYSTDDIDTYLSSTRVTPTTGTGE